MADQTATPTEFEGFHKSNEKNLNIKSNERRLIMLEENVHELIEKMDISHFHHNAPGSKRIFRIDFDPF